MRRKLYWSIWFIINVIFWSQSYSFAASPVFFKRNYRRRILQQVVVVAFFFVVPSRTETVFRLRQDVSREWTFEQSSKALQVQIWLSSVFPVFGCFVFLLLPMVGNVGQIKMNSTLQSNVRLEFLVRWLSVSIIWNKWAWWNNYLEGLWWLVALLKMYFGKSSFGLKSLRHASR